MYSTFVGAYPFNSGISPSTWFLLNINSCSVSCVFTVKSSTIIPSSSFIAFSKSPDWFVVLILAFVCPYQSILNSTVFVIGVSVPSSPTYVPVSVTLFT